MIKGYVCRNKGSDNIMISIGLRKPGLQISGQFYYVPGWFYQLSVRVFRKRFGFSVKPGTYKQIDISVSDAKP